MNKTYLIGAIIAASILVVATSVSIVQAQTAPWPTAQDRCNIHLAAGQTVECGGYSDLPRSGGGGDHPKP